MTRRITFILAPCALFLAGAQAISATLSVADLAPNDLIITEYLANPIGISDADGEYFEVFNTTNDNIDLDGLVVRDDGSNTFTVSMAVIAPLSFAVFSNSDGASLGITPAYIYGGSMALTNGDDEIGLYGLNELLINKVAYTDGDQFGAGIAHELAILNTTTPALTFGPALGSDFVAASLALPFGNFGSPGISGNTQVELSTVPLPASAWLLLSALGVLGWARKR